MPVAITKQSDLNIVLFTLLYRINNRSSILKLPKCVLSTSSWRFLVPFIKAYQIQVYTVRKWGLRGLGVGSFHHGTDISKAWSVLGMSTSSWSSVQRTVRVEQAEGGGQLLLGLRPG